MSWKIVGTGAVALALGACVGQSDRATATAAASRPAMPSSASASPTMGGSVNQGATNVSPAMPMAMPMGTMPTGTMPMASPSGERMTAAERRRQAREARRGNRTAMSDRDRAYMGGGMVGTPSGSMGMAPPASALGNPGSVGGVGGSNTAATGPGGTTASGSGNQPGTGGSSQTR